MPGGLDGAELAPGQVVGDCYRVVKKLGSGGMGAVYEAEHVGLGKLVALKVMLQGMSDNAELLQRFMNEARAAARIGHPNIVEVFDLKLEGRLAFIAMEKLNGEELDDRIQREGPLPVELVLKIGTELCDAMAAAHEHGIVHRDIKPPNVYLARQGRRHEVVKVLDFGVAKLAHASSTDVETKTGAVFGTPLYMAPEQLRDSKQVDARTDVYAIGATLYHALAGQPPFGATTLPELMFQIATATPARLDELRDDVPAELAELIERALEKAPDDRVQSAAEFSAALEQLANRASRPLPASAPPPTSKTLRLPESEAPKAGVDTLESVEAHSQRRGYQPPRRLAWIAAGGFGLLGLALLVWRVGAGEKSPIAPTANESSIAPAASVVTRLPAPPSAQPAPHTESRRLVWFVTDPAGASVMAGERELCAPTPCSARVSELEEPVRASLRGFVGTKTPLPRPLPPELRLELRRASGGRLGNPPGPQDSPPPPATGPKQAPPLVPR